MMSFHHLGNAIGSCVRKACLAGLVVASLVWVPPARAAIAFVNMFRNNTSQQISNGNVLTPVGSFFSTDLISTNANEFSFVQMTFPGPSSPVSLSPINSTTYRYQTPFLPNQAAMDAAFPFGTYQYQTTGGGSPSTSYAYSLNAYPLSQPYLTGTNYSDLQGANASAPITFQYDAFITNPQANQSNIFLTIFDSTTNTFVYDSGFLAPTTTSVVLPANTLQPGHNYIYELIFDSRIFVPSPGANFQAQIGFELRTDGTFFTSPAAVPEPASLTLCGLGLVALLGATRRWRKPAA